MAATQFEIDNALMAGRAYFDTRASINRFPVPQGWVEFNHRALDSGFEAISFTDSARIVISYAGTGPGLSDWDANAGLALGLGSDQLRQAALYYVEVKSANPGATISFTGHSLGGGLAALMGVMFDEQAITFDQAPFAASHTVGIRDDLIAYLNANGYDNAALNTLAPELLVYDPVAAGSDPALNRLDNLTSYYVQGDVLHELPVSPPFSALGTEAMLLQNSIGLGLGGSISLHSQALLTAFLENDAFRSITFKLPELLKMVFDSALYYNEPNKLINPQRNFLEHLLRHQTAVVGTGAIAADAMVTRFTADLWKLAKDRRLTLTDLNPAERAAHYLSNALTAFALQFYYEGAHAADATKELFSAISWGIQFDISDVPRSRNANEEWGLAA